MRIDYDKVQAAVKTLETVTDNDAFLEGFLSAFGFPKATFTRLKAEAKSRVNKGFHIQGNGGIFFLTSTATNLNSEFGILKRNNLNKIKEAFIVIANETDLLAYERDSGEVLETSKRELYKHIEFFFSLLGIKPDAVPNEMKSADIKASEKFAELYNELGMRNLGRSNDIAELLCRLLFCCFTESIGVLTSGSLCTLTNTYTAEDGSDTGSFLCNLFEAMKSESHSGLPGYFLNVNYVDSRLFGDALLLLDFSRRARTLLLDLFGLDWSEISPEILGALIQSVIRPTAQKNYTSTSVVQKVIGPLFMDDLYRTFDQIRANREECKTLFQRVRQISVFDPASGAGNFLLVTYKELYKLARKINTVIDEFDKSAVLDYHSSASQVAEGSTSSYVCEPIISPKNFYGIDEDPFSCAIARLGFLFVVCQELKEQADVKEVFTKSIGILFDKNIVEGDATRDDWDTVCRGNGETYVIGNPLYVGARKQTDEQKAALQHVFKEYQGIANLDYAACWFLLATKYICAHGGGFAFVTTNSLTQGEQVNLLWPKLLEKGVHIRFGHTSFKWRNDARNRTAVTVVVIGVVPNSNQKSRELYTPSTVYEPIEISPYLASGNTIARKRMTSISNLPPMVKGNMPLYWSRHLLSHESKVDLVARDPRVEKFLKRIVGGDELIDGIEKWCFWISDDALDEARAISVIAEKIELVYQARKSSTDKSANKHADRSHQFREIRETHTQSLVIPEVSSEHREYFQIDFRYKDTIVESTNYVIYDCDPWLFGVIASKMHNIWVRTVCGALETRIRYSPRLGYNTFPFPNITKEQKDEITRRVRGVIATREMFPEMALAQLYDPEEMPGELKYAHFLLDSVIDRCYRDTPFVSDQDRLDCLFDLYTKMGD